MPDVPGEDIARRGRGGARTPVVVCHRQGAGAQLSVGYSTDLFKAETIEEMIASYRQLLESVLHDPAQRISDLTSGAKANDAG